MYALRVASLYPPRMPARGWILGPALWQHPTGPFTRPVWRAGCGCSADSPHDDPPAEHGRCGLYALVRGTLVVWPAAFTFEREVAADQAVGSVLYRSSGWEALIIVEALGRTCRGERGLIRSAVQVPQCIVPHRTGYGADDEVLRVWPGLAEDLSARYECDVVWWDEFRQQLRRLVPGVAVRYVTERRSHDGS